MRNVFQKISRISHAHFVAICFALLTGLIVVGPQFAFIIQEGPHYKGVYMFTGDELHYLSSMHEFYDEGRIGNPYLLEHKYYGPQFWSSGAETILAAPGVLFHIPVPTLNLIYKFLLPAIGFLLAYGLLFRLTRSVPWSIAGTLLAFLGVIFFDGEYFMNFLRHDQFFQSHFLFVSRPINPELSGILMFAYLHVLLSLHEGKSRKWLFVLGAILGLSFYTYFYSFTLFLGLNVVFAGMWFFFGRRPLAYGMGATTLAGIVAGIPPLWQIYLATHQPEYSLLAQNGLAVESQHRPIANRAAAFAVFVLGFVAYITRFYKENKILRDYALYVVGLLLASFFVLNQQVISGVVIQYYHYIWEYNQPLFPLVYAFASSIFFVHLSARFPKLRFLNLAVPVALSLLAIAMGIYIQYSAYMHFAPIAHEDQRYIPALQWLNDHTPKESVVMANESLSELIPVYTRDNVMWNTYHVLCCYLVPPERAAFTPATVLAAPNFFRAIKAYRVDYILWDSQKDPDWNLSRLHLQPLYTADGLSIYALPQ